MKTGEILLYDVIGQDWFGEGITAKSFNEQLTALDLRPGDTLTLRVNSPGGSVFDGYAIYNMLLACPATKTAKVEGLAASAASYVIQGCDVIEVAEASFVMIHDAWGITVGNADDHVTAAAELEKFDGVIAGIYAKRSGRPVSEFADLMAAETWFTGAEAVEAKLADKITASEEAPAESVAARVDERFLSRFRQVPAALKAKAPAALPFPARFAPAAIVRTEPEPKAEGKVLSAANETRLTRIKELAQEVLDSAANKSDAADSFMAGIRDEVLAIVRAELPADSSDVLRAQIRVAQLRIDTIEARLGLRKE